jgi:general secretion pathway protein K
VASRRERGYAMIAAVAAVAVFGYLALAAIAGGRSAVVAASAGKTRAKLTADADAGVAIAIHDLGLGDPTQRWSVTGPPHQVSFQDATLTITVEDENGKIPLNFIRADQLHRLFEQAGADPREIDGLVEAFIDLRGDPQPKDSTPAAGFPRIDDRIAAQRGLLSSLDELMLLPGMTPALYARIAPAVTIHASTPVFDPRTASPLALAVMQPANANSPGAIQQARERAGQTTALGEAPPISLNDRTITVRVDAADGHGGFLRRTAVVQFTGAAARPYVMRGLE